MGQGYNLSVVHCHNLLTDQTKPNQTMIFKVVAIHLLLLLVLVSAKSYEGGSEEGNGGDEGKEEEKYGGKEDDKYDGKEEEKHEGKEEEKYEDISYQPGADEGKEKEGKEGECVFSIDCSLKVKRCNGKGCRCVFGKCHDHDHDPWDKHPDECDTYKDCECKLDPKNCFCHGFESNQKCLNEAWECHQDPAKNLTMEIPWVKVFQESPVECAALEKCKGKKCSCHFFNTCENECDKPEDCKKK